MRPIIAIPVTLLIVVRSYRRKSLTPLGLVSAALTAAVHALHPSALPFALLIVFFVLGTAATKVKHDVKATLTQSSSGHAGGEGPRSSVQVFANSAAASILILVHVYLYGPAASPAPDSCFGATPTTLSDALLWGVVANYAAVTADTLSSELGILSKSKPLLITTLRTVPPGTNGGVSGAGLLAGVGGAVAIALSTLPFLRFCPDGAAGLLTVLGLVSLLGTAGTLLDSLLGAILQASVVDRRTGKIIEGANGAKVAITANGTHKRTGSEESRIVNSGTDILDNNQINFLMAALISAGGVAAGLLVL